MELCRVRAVAVARLLSSLFMIELKGPCVCMRGWPLSFVTADCTRRLRRIFLANVHFSPLLHLQPFNAVFSRNSRDIWGYTRFTVDAQSSDNRVNQFSLRVFFFEIRTSFVKVQLIVRNLLRRCNDESLYSKIRERTFTDKFFNHFRSKSGSSVLYYRNSQFSQLSLHYWHTYGLVYFTMMSLVYL